MDEESKYRVEEPEETPDEEQKGLFRPLPEIRKEPLRRKEVIVELLGFKMTESKRDLVLMLLLPFLISIIDASIYSAIIVEIIPDSMLYLFVLPCLAALPIGLLVPQIRLVLISAILAAVFFVIVLLLFLITPGFMVPEVGIGEFFVTGMVVAAVYFLFVMFASLLGTITGVILREFF